MDKVILIRGVPGSGKTTFAKENFGETHTLIEADDYFMVGNVYCFDHGKLSDAHKWCRWRFDQCFVRNIPVVVVNTFTRFREMKHYLFAAPNAKVYRMGHRFKNIHGVPDEVIDRMTARFEDLPDEVFVHDNTL